MVALIPPIINIIGLLCVALVMVLMCLMIMALLMRQLSPLITEPLRKSFDHIDEMNMP
jgi:hypothetical protein